MKIVKGKTYEWSLYDKDDKYLKPIGWVGGNQKSSVNDILTVLSKDEENECDQSIVFFYSLCGSGKSAVLLNVIKEVGRGIIVVPSLPLQSQYSDSYAGNDSMYILKDNDDPNSKLKIGTMFGRNNFVCKYMQDAVKKGETVLDDGLIIYDPLKITCATKGLPCNKVLRKGENRISVGCKCPYYVIPPRLRSDIDNMKELIEEGIEETRLDIALYKLGCDEVKYYNACDGNEYALFIRNEPDTVCSYYRQFYNYLEDFCDVIVFNKWKWEIETKFGRKPVVDIECIDEADDFLNGLNQSIYISTNMIDKLHLSVNEKDSYNIYDKKIQIMKNDIISQFNFLHKKVVRSVSNGNLYDSNDDDVKKLIDKMYLLVDIIQDLRVSGKIDVDDKDDNILEFLYKLNVIYKYIDKCSLSGVESSKTIGLQFNIPYPDLILKDLFSRCAGSILMCSGTKHSDFTLSELFGLEFSNIINGRQDQPGMLTVMKPKYNMVDVNYKNWNNPDFQKYYNGLLIYIVTQLNNKGNTLVLTPAKKYVYELVRYIRGKNGNLVVDFSGYDTDQCDYKDDKIGNQITVSYRMKRGVDLKQDLCRVVVWTKYPYIDLSDGYVKSLFKRFGKKTWGILNDIANMDTIQGVCRGLRSDSDWTIFATPDTKVYNVVEKWWNEQMKIKGFR